jgi:UDP-N-acetylglucosamine--N-acetylmuramyl-(pentapeptide) pyrophosphoryl-undecaprenol N-acetylglucosamine transferase
MTAVLVGSNGGHLSQLVELGTRIDGLDNDRLWVTFDTPQSRSLLEGRRTKFIDLIGERDVVGVCRGAITAHKIMHEIDVSAVVSTGSGIALSFLPYAAARGIKAHYIESAARVSSPSLTGRLLERTPRVHLYRQYPHAARGRWKYGGSVFDGFHAVKQQGHDIRRIVVTLGIGLHGFRRLIDRLVTILPSNIEVLWQTGSTPIDGLAISARPIMPAAEMKKAIQEADAVIGHAGCGSALSVLNAGKCPVLIPREQQHGELVDNHQVEIARWLDERGLALYRTPETVSFDDLVAASARRIARRSDPPAFKLA